MLTSQVPSGYWNRRSLFACRLAHFIP